MQQSDDLIHIVRVRQAKELLKDRLVRRVTIQPTPPKGKVALSLTALGRAMKVDTAPPSE